MAGKAKLLVRPGSPDLPEYVDINCSGLDPAATVELVINTVVRHTAKVDPDGTVNKTYNVPTGNPKVDLADLTSCATGIYGTKWDIAIARGVLCGRGTGLGDNMHLRYQ